MIDAFNGSAVVGYMYKSKGLAVTANDRLRYCWHVARAIVENSGVTLSDDEIESLLAVNSNTGGFVQQNFKGLYFANGVHQVIDAIRANIDSLKGYKKDIALFALGKSCITGKSGFGHFGTTVHHDDREDSPERFKQRFADNCRRINALVFDNDKECKAHNGDRVTSIRNSRDRSANRRF